MSLAALQGAVHSDSRGLWLVLIEVRSKCKTHSFQRLSTKKNQKNVKYPIKAFYIGDMLK